MELNKMMEREDEFGEKDDHAKRIGSLPIQRG